MKQKLLKLSPPPLPPPHLKSLWKHQEESLYKEFKTEIELLQKAKVFPADYIIGHIMSMIQNENANFVEK